MSLQSPGKYFQGSHEHTTGGGGFGNGGVYGSGGGGVLSRAGVSGTGVNKDARREDAGYRNAVPIGAGEFIFSYLVWLGMWGATSSGMGVAIVGSRRKGGIGDVRGHGGGREGGGRG